MGLTVHDCGVDCPTLCSLHYMTLLYSYSLKYIVTFYRHSTCTLGDYILIYILPAPKDHCNKLKPPLHYETSLNIHLFS